MAAAAKRKTSLTLDAALLDEARSLGLNLRAVVVGTVAFQVYGPLLGVRFANTAGQTGDLDLAQFHSISVLVDDQVEEGLLAKLKEVDSRFEASLGFCHQALYVRRACLAETPFDDRPGRTDSDTLQIGRLLERRARIGILSEVLAIRGGEPGLSADLERTARSIRTTLSEEYPELTAANIEAILAFRRRCEAPGAILRLLDHPDPDISGHLARMVLDTLFQRQSGALDAGVQARLLDTALSVLEGEGALPEVERLIAAQDRRAALLEEAGLHRETALLHKEIIGGKSIREERKGAPERSGKPRLCRGDHDGRDRGERGQGPTLTP